MTECIVAGSSTRCPVDSNLRYLQLRFNAPERTTNDASLMPLFHYFIFSPLITTTAANKTQVYIWGKNYSVKSLGKTSLVK